MENYGVKLLKDTLATGREFIDSYFPTLRPYLTEKVYNEVLQEALKQTAYIEMLLEKIKELNLEEAF